MPSIWGGKRLTVQAQQVRPGYQVRLRSAAGSGLIRRAFLPGERLWSLRAIEHPRWAHVALSQGASFYREKLALFLVPTCEFSVVCFSQGFSRALSQHSKSLFAPKATLAVVTASQSDLCQQKLATILCDRFSILWSPQFWNQTFHPKVRFCFLWPTH